MYRRQAVTRLGSRQTVLTLIAPPIPTLTLSVWCCSVCPFSRQMIKIDRYTDNIAGATPDESARHIEPYTSCRPSYCSCGCSYTGSFSSLGSIQQQLRRTTATAPHSTDRITAARSPSAVFLGQLCKYSRLGQSSARSVGCFVACDHVDLSGCSCM